MIRHSRNPLLTRRDIPDLPPDLIDVTSVFNPGAVKIESEYILLLRVQNRGRESYLMTARSADGLAFEVERAVVSLTGRDRIGHQVYHFYDPRITRLDGQFYVTLSMDTPEGCRVGLFRTDNFRTLDFFSLLADEDSRNGVLFPERIGGRYLALLRPNRDRLAGGVVSGSEIWLYESDDLENWRPGCKVIGGRRHYWDELIGSGPPPVKTSEGWLHIYHGIATHPGALDIYQAGALLLDSDDPSRVTTRTRFNILEPRESYETTGQVPNVVFPTGMIVKSNSPDGVAAPDSRVLVYYGAADTVVGLAETTVAHLLQKCREGNNLA